MFSPGLSVIALRSLPWAVDCVDLLAASIGIGEKATREPSGPGRAFAILKKPGRENLGLGPEAALRMTMPTLRGPRSAGSVNRRPPDTAGSNSEVAAPG